MKHKILVAIDESENAKRAVEFVAKTSLPEHEITLFSVIPDTAAICEMNSPELTPHFLAHQVEFCSMEDKKRELVEQAAQKAKAILQKAGFDEKNIKIKMVNRKKGITAYHSRRLRAAMKYCGVISTFGSMPYSSRCLEFSLIRQLVN